VTFLASTCQSSWRPWAVLPHPRNLLPLRQTRVHWAVLDPSFEQCCHQARHRRGERTDQPELRVNHIPPTLDADAFRHTLAARPAVISFALGDPGDLVRQAHGVGSKVMIQITTVAQAIEAAERGADVIIAQGGEAGGYGGLVSTMTLVPQVVDVVSPIPWWRPAASLTDAALRGVHAGGGRRQHGNPASSPPKRLRSRTHGRWQSLRPNPRMR